MTFSNIAYGGEAAAVGASVCWTATSFLFARAGEVTKPLGINLFRLPLAAVCLGTFLYVTTGSVLPEGATPWQLWMLALSAFLGLAFGDAFYFRSLTLIGPRRATLLSASAPIITALLAIPILNERMGALAWCGVLSATGGIIWVIAEQHDTGPPAANLKAGAILGMIGAVGQASGMLVAKVAMNGVLPAVPSAFFRMLSASIMVWVFGLFMRRTRDVAPLFNHPRAMKALILASLLGPVTGVSLVLFAYRTTEAGVVATLSTLYPLFVIPIVWLRHRDVPTARTLAGTFVAVGGVALIFLR